MRTCRYCGRSLGEGQSFCSDYCRVQTKKYETFTERRKGVFAVSVCVCFLAVLFGSLAVFLGLSYADYILNGGSLAMGLVLLILPFAPAPLIEKHGIEKACFLVRSLGFIFVLWGAWQLFS